ncbi:hypothetical protein CVO96_00315 [Deinococcus koreensis]|uniref:LysM domain-containing protein n=2 Tax=Deinococcus koreensis TaxID=2054903 RepID=A0A2K3UTY4_9DEIO|nr:hypothetical protein CVO96_00315 [Deinococcus koreensis]
MLGLALLASAGAQGYTVQPGDTFWELAQRYGVAVAALQAANPGELRAGQVLQLPGAAPRASADDAPVPAATVFQRGQAVYYGGRRDARTVMTAAHLSLPMGTWVRVVHQRSGRSVDVLINDRGPFGIPSRIIDLSDDAARVLGILSEGIAPVTLTILSRP